MKIRLDAAKCDGFGTCAEHSPELFELDEWGYASVKGDGEVPPELEGKVNRAIADCPVHAIIAG
ncbi:ferredoxin [Saccharomonospora azurea]|uniref:ferredoxin n=1 Tax=Saccharomonospora azurea TaxID=40988 RepID=UPI0033283FDD